MCELKDVKQWRVLCSCVLTAFKSGCLRTALSSPPQDSLHPLSPTILFFPPDPNIFLGKMPIKVVKEAKFLGLIFDTKLIFKNHVQYLKYSCQKALNIPRAVGHTDWGADRIILLCLYHVLVCSKLDYGCIVYGSAHRLVLN